MSERRPHGGYLVDCQVYKESAGILHTKLLMPLIPDSLSASDGNIGVACRRAIWRRVWHAYAKWHAIAHTNLGKEGAKPEWERL